MDISEIKRLIARGDTETALKQIQRIAAGTRFENDAALLEARFQKNQRERNLGLVTEEHWDKEANQINYALLGMLDSLGKPAHKKDPSSISVSSRLLWLAGGMLLLALAWYLSQNPQKSAPAVFEFQYVQKGIPFDVQRKLDSLQKAGQMIKHLAFGPAGEWVILYGRHQFLDNGNLSSYLKNRLDTARLKDAEIKGLSLGNNSNFLMWYNRNEFWYSTQPQGIPTRLTDSLWLYYHQNREIKDVSISPDQSWVILWGRNGYTFEGIHDSLRMYLNRTATVFNEPFKNIAFSLDNGWVLTSGYNRTFYGFVDPDLVKAMEQIQKDRKEIYQISLRRHDEWIIFYR